jgi:hypothetical protein
MPAAKKAFCTSKLPLRAASIPDQPAGGLIGQHLAREGERAGWARLGPQGQRHRSHYRAAIAQAWPLAVHKSAGTTRSVCS